MILQYMQDKWSHDKKGVVLFTAYTALAWVCGSRRTAWLLTCQSCCCNSTDTVNICLMKHFLTYLHLTMGFQKPAYCYLLKNSWLRFHCYFDAFWLVSNDLSLFSSSPSFDFPVHKNIPAECVTLIIVPISPSSAANDPFSPILFMDFYMNWVQTDTFKCIEGEWQIDSVWEILLQSCPSWECPVAYFSFKQDRH